MKTFQEMISPHEAYDFIATYWTQKALYIPGDRSKFARLFGWRQFNEVLNYQTFSYPRLRMARAGKVLPESDLTELTTNRRGITAPVISPAKVMALCQEGATLIVDAIDKAEARLERFTTGLAADLGEKIQINAYCSWPGVQGFDTHYDTHDVFVLQVAGKKEWALYDFTMKFPLPRQKSRPEDAPGNPAWKNTLAAGDVLYIPRGLWHSALATQEPSLHLTVGISCRTGIDFLQWLMSELGGEEMLRENLPLQLQNKAATGYDPTALAGAIESYKNLLLAWLRRPDLVQRYNRHVVAGDKATSPFGLPFVALKAPLVNGVETALYRPASQRALIEAAPDADEVRVYVWEKELIFHGPVLALVQKIFSHEKFSASDVLRWEPQFDWEEEIKPVLEKLVGEQILFVGSPE